MRSVKTPAFTFLLLSIPATLLAAPPEKVRFNEHIRPILSDRCFYCHGPDEKKREAELRIDTRDGATRDLGGRAAIVPGKPDDSELFIRVTEDDPNAMMPPPKAKKPRLSADEVALIKKWIEQGAEYEGHWAFLPLRKDPPPDVKNAAWVKNPIDRFILARLEQEGIHHSPEADRATLIRRLSIDLLGLLPSPDEVEQFVNDAKPNAYEELVERLLASPHYGERWGRHWLDQARYADSNGYAIDAERDMWPYRDWVIKALNDDMPFDRFTIEQLAGDLLPQPTKSQLMATAYHRNTLINTEGGTDREQFRVESVMDRVNTTGAVWLGLTVGCAQCHTHKFDPVTQREYYELMAFFNSTEDANDRGPTVSVTRGEVFGQPIASPPDETPQLTGPDLAKRRAEWEAETRARLEKEITTETTSPIAWTPAKYVEYTTAANGEFKLLSDNSLLAEGPVGSNDTYKIVASTKLPTIAAIRLRTLTHESLPKQGPGRAGNGNFVLTDFELTLGGEKQAFARAWADHEQPGYAITAAIDNETKSGWAINVGPTSKGKMNADHEAVFVLAKPIEIADRTLTFRLSHEANAGYILGRFALEFSAVAPPSPKQSEDAVLLAALQIEEGKRRAGERKTVQDAFERAEPRAQQPLRRPNPNVGQLMIMRDLAKPRESYLLTRGDFTRPDKTLGLLEAGVLKAVSPPFDSVATTDSRRTRLDLAKWLVHPGNSLTPRVTINRIWMRYFGRGLVETDEDFGTQGAPPTHPALLDWLAREFVSGQWSVKHMHRLIVTSATYRQSSKPRADMIEKDPRNLLLARQERVRFEAEIARDAALGASGLLDRTIGGPSVKPPQPDGVYAFTQVNKKWDVDNGPGRYRRGMYTFFYRSAPYPLFTTFDAPDFQAVCTRRLRSNTPLQSLTLANDAAFVEMAQGLALRLARELPGDVREQLDARLRRAFLLCLSRPPTPKEQALLRDYFLRQLKDYSTDESAAEKLASADLLKTVSKPEAAALVCLARAVFNTDNFIMRE